MTAVRRSCFVCGAADALGQWWQVEFDCGQHVAVQCSVCHSLLCGCEGVIHDAQTEGGRADP